MAMSSAPTLSVKIRQFAAYLAKPDILFYALPWLMVLVVMGTVAQKELGLYIAVEKYINSIVVWFGPIPLPGGLTTIAVIFIALSVKFIFFSKWRWRESGIILTHLGVLLLLLGGLITANLMREGFMIIPEGQSNNAIADYQDRTVVILEDNIPLRIFNFNDLSVGQELELSGLKIKILDLCDNCSARAPSGKYDNLQGLAVNMELFGVPSEKNIEANFSGMVLTLHDGPDKEVFGTYMVMEDIPKNPVFDVDGKKIEIKLERAKDILPFAIQLKDFRKIDYPGTRKAREFESDLIVRDGNLSWPVTVSMNEPLRYKGYTFYQSSFEQRPDVEVTVLSVVKNAGWLFPYISTLVIFAGLLLHLIIRVQYTEKNNA